jgi:hypothetical protein|tara:strand:- start:211 stop:453 length:243 start_codon:yes stop_codon:yes gene_type:complete
MTARQRRGGLVTEEVQTKAQELLVEQLGAQIHAATTLAVLESYNALLNQLQILVQERCDVIQKDLNKQVSDQFDETLGDA